MESLSNTLVNYIGPNFPLSFLLPLSWISLVYIWWKQRKIEDSLLLSAGILMVPMLMFAGKSGFRVEQIMVFFVITLFVTSKFFIQFYVWLGQPPLRRIVQKSSFLRHINFRKSTFFAAYVVLIFAIGSTTTGSSAHVSHKFRAAIVSSRRVNTGFQGYISHLDAVARYLRTIAVPGEKISLVAEQSRDPYLLYFLLGGEYNVSILARSKLDRPGSYSKGRLYPRPFIHWKGKKKKDMDFVWTENMLMKKDNFPRYVVIPARYKFFNRYFRMLPDAVRVWVPNNRRFIVYRLDKMRKLRELAPELAENFTLFDRYVLKELRIAIRRPDAIRFQKIFNWMEARFGLTAKDVSRIYANPRYYRVK